MFRVGVAYLKFKSLELRYWLGRCFLLFGPIFVQQMTIVKYPVRDIKKTKPRILQFTNSKCYKMSFKAFKLKRLGLKGFFEVIKRPLCRTLNSWIGEFVVSVFDVTNRLVVYSSVSHIFVDSTVKLVPYFVRIENLKKERLSKITQLYCLTSQETHLISFKNKVIFACRN